MGNPQQSYGELPAICLWDYAVIPATRRRWMRPAFNPARQAGTRFTFPEGTEGWVSQQ